MNTREEINTLGRKYPEMLARFPVALSLSALFLFFFLTFRIMNGCDTLLSAFGTTIFGLLTGSVLVAINLGIFGREAINFTGLPLLVSRTSEGLPLYVCSTLDNQ